MYSKKKLLDLVDHRIDTETEVTEVSRMFMHVVDKRITRRKKVKKKTDFQFNHGMCCVMA